MRLLFIIFTFVSTNLLAQKSSGGGYYKLYHDANIKSYSYFQFDSLTSTSFDTTFLKRVSFDKNGLMAKEEFGFKSNYNSGFKYEYNQENYLINIDTFGLIGYGYGSAGPDTLVSQICERWEHFDTTSRIIFRKTTDESSDYELIETFVYDNSGKLIRSNSLHSRNGISIESYTNYIYSEKGLPLSYLTFSRNGTDDSFRFISGQFWVYEYW